VPRVAPSGVECAGAGPSALELSPEQKRLIDLVDYVRHMVELAERPVFALEEYRQLHYHEADLQGRIGIHHDLTDEDGPVWLKIERLKRTDPPPVPEAIRDWVTVGRDPTRVPTVKAQRVETMRREEAERLVQAGTVAAADVLSVLKGEATWELRDVVFRLERMPEVRAALDAYLQGPWARWAAEERPRRETIATYDALFSTHQAIQSEGADQPLELVWGIGLARWRVGGQVIDHPLIGQLVELAIDPVGGAISVRPRTAEPQVALKPYLALERPGAELLLDFARRHFAGLTEDRELSPYIAGSFEPVLRQAAAQLDEHGVYYPDVNPDITDRRPPEAADTLTVCDTWVLYVRRRSDNFFLTDLERLKEAIGETPDLPGPAGRLVTEPSDEGGYRSPILGGLLGGVGGSTGGGYLTPGGSTDSTRADGLFFPKPFNDEQVSIIQRLDATDGVVVQGPPGTGKTHTIANIICHYLVPLPRGSADSTVARPAGGPSPGRWRLLDRAPGG
jgi:hypothetical protein